MPAQGRREEWKKSCKEPVHLQRTKNEKYDDTISNFNNCIRIKSRTKVAMGPKFEMAFFLIKQKCKMTLN
jgi:hypothetical protein